MLPHNGIIIFMVAYPLFSGSGTVNYSRDIHFLLFYSIWTLRTTPIQLVSVLFIAALYTVPNLI